MGMREASVAAADVAVAVAATAAAADDDDDDEDEAMCCCAVVVIVAFTDSAIGAIDLENHSLHNWKSNTQKVCYMKQNQFFVTDTNAQRKIQVCDMQITTNIVIQSYTCYL